MQLHGHGIGIGLVKRKFAPSPAIAGRGGWTAFLAILFAVLLFSFGNKSVLASGSQWTEMAPAHAPPARVGHGMAYDSQSDRVILFGGETAPGSNVLYNDTWAYDLNSNTWENRDRSPRPIARFAHAMAYDADSDRVILFGGWTGTQQSNETWAYDYNTDTWTSMAPASHPTVGVFVEMAYDAASDRMILFGGSVDRDGGRLSSETWAYDFDSNRWTRMTPAASPAAREIQGMAYDSAVDRTILFGGRDATRDFGDTWVYDYHNDMWTSRSPVSSPSGRHGAALAYDAGSDGAVLFGGVTVTGSTLDGDETWIYNVDRDAWRQAEKGSGPSERFSAGMADDTESSRIVLFGGAYGTGTWAGGGWRVSSPGTDYLPILAAIAIVAGGAAAALGLLLWRKRRQGRKPG